MSTNAWAAGAPCTAPRELEAIKTAAVQQELMVAALSCNATPRYNQFVTTFQEALQASDRALQAFFRRTEGRGATAAYHAFKTRMANAASRKSIAHITNYCDGAEVMFVSALDSGPPNLAGFLSAQPSAEADQYSVCDNLPVMTFAELATPPTFVSLPRLKPSQVVAPALGLTLRTSLDLTAVSF
jgi:hypothetical protein